MLIKTTINFIILLFLLTIPATAFSFFTNTTPDAFIEKSVKYMQNNDYESLTRLTYQFENEYDDYFYNGQKKFVDFIMKQDDEAFMYLSDIKWEYSLSGVIGGLKETGTIAVKLKKDLKKLMTTDKEVINWKNRIDSEITVLKEKYEAENRLKRKRQLEIDMIKAKKQKKQDEADRVERERQQKIYVLEREKSIKEKEEKIKEHINDVNRISNNIALLTNMTQREKTPLVWERKNNYNSKLLYTFNEANQYCSKLAWAGYDDWYLPTYNELNTLNEYNEIYYNNRKTLFRINTRKFPNVSEEANGIYWTSERQAISFIDGQKYSTKENNVLNVRCVRQRMAVREIFESVLLDAVFANDIKQFTVLLNFVHPDTPSSRTYAKGKTPLIIAAKNGYTEIVKKLIDVGADINAVDEVGKTALQYAIENNFKDMSHLQIQHLKVANSP